MVAVVSCWHRRCVFYIRHDLLVPSVFAVGSVYVSVSDAWSAAAGYSHTKGSQSIGLLVAFRRYCMPFADVLSLTAHIDTHASCICLYFISELF